MLAFWLALEIRRHFWDDGRQVFRQIRRYLEKTAFIIICRFDFSKLRFKQLQLYRNVSLRIAKELLMQTIKEYYPSSRTLNFIIYLQ